MTEDPKAALRRELRGMRQRMSAKEITERSGTIVRHVASASFYQRARTIGLYHPTDNEVDPSRLFLDAAATGKEIFLPIPDKSSRSLSFVAYRPGDPMHVGSFGILEPIPSGSVVDADRLDLIFLPLVGFDRLGCRLGFGGGYYDRTLARLEGEDAQALRLTGLAYAFQELPSIPRAPHDVMMGRVVTENGVLLCKGSD
ncbi:MAG: 5-formyltetrahydrofolate cyclo-ligase [Magnetococcales bacterium]|nr:5-formyltetrahydrofolate cyclo-ligase [Magnetococcales bacterium]